MDYQTIVTEVLGTRFRETQRARAKNWVRQRYADVWAAADWPWKIVPPASLTVTAGDVTPTLPTDLLRPITIFDQDGDRLLFLEAAQFWADFQGATDTGDPSYWTWTGGQVHLAPIPSTDRTYSLAYRRRIAHMSGSPGVITPGNLAADTDSPIWAEDEYDHGLLIDGALSLGLKRSNDPTWQEAEGAWQFGVQMMIAELMPVAGGNRSYAGDTL